MTSNHKFAVAAVMVMALLLVGLLGLMQGTAQAANPGPLAIPTPVSINPASGAAKVATFFTTRVITADGGSDAQNIQNAGKMDFQWVTDQTAVAGAPNTVTLKLQFSNDGVNWIDGATALSASFADANDMQQYAVFGRFARVYADVSNSNPLTVTAIGVAK